MSDPVQVEDEGPVRTVRIHRPEKKNALTAAMYAVMAQALEEASGRDDIRVVAIAGVPGAFTAGNDIADFQSSAESGRLPEPTIRFLLSVAMIERPLMAIVDGLAVGIGTTLLLHCDHVVASTRSLFRTPFTDLGLVPEAGSSLLAPALMGRQAAFRLLAMGEPLDAAGALAAGLVTTLVSPATVEAAGRAAAQAIAAKPPGAMAATRRLLHPDRAAVVARIHAEAAEFGARLSSAEAQAAFRAFLKRG